MWDLGFQNAPEQRIFIGFHLSTWLKKIFDLGLQNAPEWGIFHRFLSRIFDLGTLDEENIEIQVFRIHQWNFLGIFHTNIKNLSTFKHYIPKKQAFIVTFGSTFLLPVQISTNKYISKTVATYPT